MAGRPSRLEICLKMYLANFWYFSSPSHWMNEFEGRRSPRRYAVRPFSEKQKSKSAVTGKEGVPSCSCCLLKSEPPTCKRLVLEHEWIKTSCSQSRTEKCEDVRRLSTIHLIQVRAIDEVETNELRRELTNPIATLCLNLLKVCNISAETPRLAGVKVPSTSNKQTVSLIGRSVRVGYNSAMIYGGISKGTETGYSACMRIRNMGETRLMRYTHSGNNCIK